jgi:hypothetical protein
VMTPPNTTLRGMAVTQTTANSMTEEKDTHTSLALHRAGVSPARAPQPSPLRGRAEVGPIVGRKPSLLSGPRGSVPTPPTRPSHFAP